MFLVTHICYISNERRFTKSALRILLLSITFPVSSINYYLVCSIPIYALCAAYLARFLCYSRRKTPTTLKSGSKIALFATPLAFNARPPMEGFRWDNIRKISHGGQKMAKPWRNSSNPSVGCTNVTYDRQTDDTTDIWICDSEDPNVT